VLGRRPVRVGWGSVGGGKVGLGGGGRGIAGGGRAGMLMLADQG